MERAEDLGVVSGERRVGLEGRTDLEFPEELVAGPSAVNGDEHGLGDGEDDEQLTVVP